MTFTTTITVVALILVTGSLYFGFTLYLMKRSRKGRTPIGKDVKLLRQPGESLRTKIETIDEKLNNELLAGVMAPLGVSAIPLIALGFAPVGNGVWIGLAAIVGGVAISIAYRVRRTLQMVKERRNYQLGLMGERVVADSLDELKKVGFSVFHDLPAQGAEDEFNLDHVAVGPTGLFLIETKTRRKSAIDTEGNDHKVRFDGDALLWPQWRDTETIRQVRQSARWLEQWIKQRIGRNHPITPLIAVPGWYTDESSQNGLRVCSHKRLTHYMTHAPRTLDPETIDLIARQLDSLGRDIPFEG